MTRYLIVGGSIAGASAIRSILTTDPAAQIKVISNERPFYYRPLITHLLDGSKTEEDLSYEADIPVDVINARAVSLNTKTRTVTLDSSGEVPFDRLLIATGSSALVPDIAGIEKTFSVRSIGDAERLGKSLGENKKAVVIGGGFVGIKTAEALLKAGLQVTVVEMLGQILHPRLDMTAAEVVRSRLEERGIRILTSESATEILPNGVKLASGGMERAEIVVSAVGTAPNIQWLEGSGIKVNSGVVIDEMLTTSAAGIYAAGDVAETIEIVSQRPMVSALWTNAVEMGRAAGYSMADRKMKYPGFLEIMNASEIGGLPMISAGSVTPEGDEIHTSNGDVYRKLVFDGDVLKGMILMGNIRKAGLYVNLLKTRRPIGVLKDKAIAGTLSYADFSGKGITATD